MTIWNNKEALKHKEWTSAFQRSCSVIRSGEELTAWWKGKNQQPPLNNSKKQFRKLNPWMQILANCYRNLMLMGPLSEHFMLLFKIINAHIHWRGMVQDNQSRQLKQQKNEKQLVKTLLSSHQRTKITQPRWQKSLASIWWRKS